MKKLFSAILLLCAGFASLCAQGFPTISDGENTKWYIIQFMNGGKAIASTSDGAEAKVAMATGSEEEQWKITGNDTDGYRFTNKKGYTLYVNSANLNEKVRNTTAGSEGVCDFFITPTPYNAYSGAYEIKPKGNTGISMNLWGGPSDNRGVGLWNSSNDPNNPVMFVDAATFEELGKISIIPQPTQLEVIKEGRFALSSLNAIACNDAQMQAHLNEFAAQLAKVSGIELNVKNAGESAEGGEIWFGYDKNLPEEGYTLTVGEKNIEIKASGFAGHFYALQTLKQMMPRAFFADKQQSSTAWDIPYLDINDRPTLGHRGYMLDIARHFFNKEEVMKVLDILAFYKMNRFHWHLTDDQGWRIEIPEYPKLTEVGAIRKASFSNASDGQNFYDDTEYGRGMWYSQDDLKEVVAYALARNIEIMPEVDLPGHMVAAVTAYPEFSCDPTKKYEVRVDGGISHDVLNIGDDRVIDFLKCIMDNLAAIFPHKYIHFGGDECPTEQWSTNAQCLARVQQLGLSGVNQLQSWLVEELGTYVKEKHGKDIVVWDELLAHWNNNNKIKPVIMAWNGIGYSSQAADRGMQSIIVPYSHLYLDFMQSDENNRFVDELYNGGWGVNTVEEIYGLNPVSNLQGRESYALGVQGNMWTETTNDIDEVEYQLLPRLLALAEIGWLPTAQKSWASFYKRLQSHDEIFEMLDYKYAKHYIEPTEYSDAEKAMNEAKEILAGSVRGGVGYPSAELYDALEVIYSVCDGEDVTALVEAIANYKEAPITLPQEGKYYQIISASTQYQRQYVGSTMYQKGNGVRFHYTPQTEPEELWSFTATDGGYIMTNAYSGEQLTMGAYNSTVSLSAKGTPVRIDKATIATQNFTYIPGVVTISAVDGYKAEVTGSVKRLSAEVSGDVYAKDNAALCYNGTWTIVEVNDFTTQLQGLVKKGEIILLTTTPDEMNSYTSEALDYLQNSIITPAKETLENGAVSESQYNAYVALYHAFQMMEKVSIAQSLSEDYYYYIYNVWFGKYAGYNSSSNIVAPLTKSNNDNMLWSIVKNNDGTIYIYNKATGTAAYPTAHSGEQAIKLGEEYAWRLEERTLDGKKGICIIDKSGSTSWYTNPASWNYILTKPFWGACTWEFQKSNVEVSTAIVEVENNNTYNAIYDIRGNKIESITSPGIYVINGEKVLVK